MHGVHEARSRWHSKPAWSPRAEKVKLAVRLATVFSGPESMTVSGSVVSTVGLNHGSAPMEAKADSEESELSMRQS